MSDIDLEEDFAEPDISALSQEELDELQKVNAETIQDLETDIHLLETKIKQFGPGVLPDKDFELIYRPDGTNNFEDVEKRLQKEIEDYTTRLNETMHLTGVTVENITRRVLELDDNHCKKEFSLELLLLSRKMHLTYTLEEPLSLDGKSNRGEKVTWFEIKFEEDINEAVGAEVAKAADRLAIHSVFSLLKSFLRWQTDRDQMVKRFTEMYPENVSEVKSKEGNVCLKIVHSKPDHPEFVLEWCRKTVNDRVEPDIKVEVNAPGELVQMDSGNILSSVPEMFDLMVKSLGLDKAINGLIQLVVSGGQDQHQDQATGEQAS